MDNFALGTSARYALAFAFVCLVFLALREVLSWFLKTNHIESEIARLEDQVQQLESLVIEQHKQLLEQMNPTEDKKTESVIPDPVKKQFEIDSPETEQFPLQ